MNIDFTGKKAIITGASRGIGYATAQTLAAAGADLSICARHRGHLESALQALRRYGTRVHGDVVDVADGPNLQKWVNESIARLGGVDIVVANPSAFGVGSSEADWQGSVDVDLMGSVRLINATLAELERAAARHGDAAIIMLSSVIAAETDTESAYGAIKAALIHYAKGVARRLAPKHVRVNLVSPGTIFCDGGFWDQAKQNMPELYEAYFRRNPTGRMGTAQEVANVIAFLASPAASFTTGANIIVDGAFSARVNF